jgi:hypothetical protein
VPEAAASFARRVALLRSIVGPVARLAVVARPGGLAPFGVAAREAGFADAAGRADVVAFVALVAFVGFVGFVGFLAFAVVFLPVRALGVRVVLSFVRLAMNAGVEGWRPEGKRAPGHA